MKPLVIVNCKTYATGTGSASQRIAAACARHGAWIAAQPTDIRMLAANPALRVLAQHVDDITYGAHTGQLLPEAVKHAGAYGTLLNHAERKLSAAAVGARIARCKALGLVTVVCADSVEEGEALLAYEPDYLAVEIPELISGDVSITSAAPEVVRDAVRRLGKNVLVGAGVRTHEDLAAALTYGAVGVLLASAIMTKTDDPDGALAALTQTVM